MDSPAAGFSARRCRGSRKATCGAAVAVGVLFEFRSPPPRPLFLLGLPGIALGLARTTAHRALIVVLLARGVLGQTALLFQTPPNRPAEYKGYSYLALGELW